MGSTVLYAGASVQMQKLSSLLDWKLFLQLPEHYTVKHVAYCEYNDARGNCYEVAVCSDQIPSGLSAETRLALFYKYPQEFSHVVLYQWDGTIWNEVLRDYGWGIQYASSITQSGEYTRDSW